VVEGFVSTVSLGLWEERTQEGWLDERWVLEWYEALGGLQDALFCEYVTCLGRLSEGKEIMGFSDRFTERISYPELICRRIQTIEKQLRRLLLSTSHEYIGL
jgi:hypothetical protein